MYWRFLDLVPAARAAVIECMADGVIVVDARGRVVDVNPVAQATTGWSVGDALGRPLASCFPRGRAGWRDRRGTRRPPPNWRSLPPTGRGATTRCGPCPCAGPAGRLVLLRDVSERRRADEERDRLIEELQEAVSSIETLSGLIPICAACKKVRDDQGYWQQVEEYVSAHSQVEFSHGLCPECIVRLYPDADSYGMREAADLLSGKEE